MNTFIRVSILYLHLLAHIRGIQIVTSYKPYQPTWDSLDTRPLPTWYDEAKIGIILHWGVYSVPSFNNEWFWYDWKTPQSRNNKPVVKFMENNYPKGFTYQDFAKDFTAEFWNPDEWAEIFKNAGAKYVVLTSKHHEGFTMWPSNYSFSWNAQDVGPNRDIVGELAGAVRRQNLHFGLYHSLFEWFHPLCTSDKASHYNQTKFVDQKVVPEMLELIENYRPDVLWSDGDEGAPSGYWRAPEFIAWLYNESPVKDTIVVNDRWGSDVHSKHGDFFTCPDGFNPKTLQEHKFEDATTIYKGSWGYVRDANLSNLRTVKEIIITLTQVVSCGGNLLLNIPPTKDGVITPIFQDRLAGLGYWLEINGEAIYASKPWEVQEDKVGNVWYTSKPNAVFAIVLYWPIDNILLLKSAAKLFLNEGVAVTLLGQNASLSWKKSADVIQIDFPNQATVASKWGYVIKIVS